MRTGRLGGCGDVNSCVITASAISLRPNHNRVQSANGCHLLKIKSKIDGWYFGNLIFGGLIGLVIVDPLTGSMWTLSPRELTYNLISTNLNLAPEELKEAQQKANQVEKKKAEETNKAGYR
jgi:hypothetical protein